MLAYSAVTCDPMTKQGAKIGRHRFLFIEVAKMRYQVGLTRGSFTNGLGPGGQITHDVDVVSATHTAELVEVESLTTVRQ